MLLCCDPTKNNNHGYLPPWNSPLTTPPTLKTRHFLPTSNDFAHHPALQLTNDEIRILSDPLLVPAWYPFPSAHPLHRRTRHLGDILGAIMSLYPKQTQLPVDLLRSNGLFTELVALPDHSVRRFHPLEWASALGWSSLLCLPSNLEDAWHQIGNTLSPHQALYALCSALATPTFSYDFYSLAQRLQQDSLALVSSSYTCVDFFLQAAYPSRLSYQIAPIIPPISSFQPSLFYAPRNIFLRSPTTQIVLSYQQQETFYTFVFRHHMIPSMLCTPLRNNIHPSITLQQLHLQHRFLCLTQDISFPSPVYTPHTYLTFQSQQLQGSFYLIDDSHHSVCVVNWTLGKATGSYHTNARTLQAIIQEWHPLSPFFRLLPQEDETSVHPDEHLPQHRKIYFALSVPRTFYLRPLRVHTPDLTLKVVMAISLTMDYLYQFIIDKLSLNIGSFALYSMNLLLTREHLCKHLTHPTVYLFYTTDGPQFSTPSAFAELQSLIFLQAVQTQPTSSPVTSPDRPQTYQYLLTGTLGRNFALLDSPTLPTLRAYLRRHFGTDNFIYTQNNQLIQFDLTHHPIELRTPLRGGSQIHIKGLFGTRYIYPTEYTLTSITDCLYSLFQCPSFYCIQQGKLLRNQVDPNFTVYVLGRLRGGVGNGSQPKNVHQSTPPPANANKLRKRDGISDFPPRELTQGSSSDEQPLTTLTTDEKLLLILRETKANRRESKKLTTTVRSLENEMSSSSRRLDAVEDQIGQLQGEIHQLRVSPDSKFDPSSRRPSLDSTSSATHLPPELVAKKLRTLYFRGFPINTRETLLHWIKQQDLPDYEDLYTLGSPSDTVAILFKNETDLWTFLRKCPNNKWILYETSQIYVGLDN